MEWWLAGDYAVLPRTCKQPFFIPELPDFGPPPTVIAWLRLFDPKVESSHVLCATQFIDTEYTGFGLMWQGSV
jgi:hypothetical protein